MTVNFFSRILIGIHPALVLLLLAFFLSPPAAADEIYFKSGASHTGVIIRETKETVTFKTEMGMSTVARNKVNFIEKATPEENQGLLKKWRQEEQQVKEAQQARREAERRFEQEQLAKGLIEFEGKWMTPQEKEQTLDLRRQAREHRLQFDNEQRAKGLVQFERLWVTSENAQELRRMEPEIYRLSNDIRGWRKTIDSLRQTMAGTASLEEADEFSGRIEELNQRVTEATERLGELLDRADEIEAASVHYVTPERFRGAEVFSDRPE
jgi:Skp family chaperone for outer membrane proteins